MGNPEADLPNFSNTNLQNKNTLISLQQSYTRFVHNFNIALTSADLQSYHSAREEGLALISEMHTPEDIRATTETMLEQLYWFPDVCGDREAGEEMQPEGYPDNFIYVGDARELMQHVPDQSVDLIFTDPPYIRESIELYGWLAEEADRILNPNGFLMAYVGVYWKDEAMQQIREHLDYFWDYTIIHQETMPLQRNRNTRSGSKSILCYRKYNNRALPPAEVRSVYMGTGPSKDYHPWGQPVDESTYYITNFSRPGELVLDPFIGGGTTAVACAQSGRSWIGFEIEAEYARIAQQRLVPV